MTDPVILLIEDNSDDQMLTLKAFQKVDGPYQIHTVKDGVEALDYLLRQGKYNDELAYPKPDLVLLDLKLPKLNGTEVLKKLRQDENTWSIPVVVLTSSVEYNDLEVCYRLNGNSYIRKPIDFNKFKDVIKQIYTYWIELNQPVRALTKEKH